MRYAGYAALAFMALIWLVSLPIVFIGVGMAGGEPLSLPGLVSDIRGADPNVANRLWAWFEILFPIAALVMLWRKRKRRSPWVDL